jgi:hypothetical protein
MKIHSRLALLTLALLLTPAGCGPQAPTGLSPAKGKAPDEERIRANLDKLSPEDRQLAEAQKFCVIEEENRLGSMGPPQKTDIEGQAVFLCCKGCEKRARANPQTTLAHARELREKYGPAKEKKDPAKEQGNPR